MAILVMGGDGYVGSQCVLALLDSGYDVIILDNHSSGHSEISEHFSGLGTDGKLLGNIAGDLRFPETLGPCFRKERIDAVMHFAASSQVEESMRDPAKYYANNVAGTLNLLRAMMENGVWKMVYSSSAATYGNPKYTPIDELHPQEPINPYGRTKLFIEKILDDYDTAYGLRSVSLRYFNVAGADSKGRTGEWHDPESHLIPNIIKSSFGDGKEFRLFGTDYDTRDGTCIRDYVNVEDLADAHVLALKYLTGGGRTDCFNLGTATGSTVREVFSECEKVIGKKIPLKETARRPGDPAVLVADSTKAKKVLGWEPNHTLADSIRTAYEWEKKRRGL